MSVQIPKEDLQVSNILTKIEVYFVPYEVWVGICLYSTKIAGLHKGNPISHPQHLDWIWLLQLLWSCLSCLSSASNKRERVRGKKKTPKLNLFLLQIWSELYLTFSVVQNVKMNKDNLNEKKQRVLTFTRETAITWIWQRLKGKKGMKKLWSETKERIWYALIGSLVWRSWRQVN